MQTISRSLKIVFCSSVIKTKNWPILNVPTEDGVIRGKNRMWQIFPCRKYHVSCKLCSITLRVSRCTWRCKLCKLTWHVMLLITFWYLQLVFIFFSFFCHTASVYYCGRWGGRGSIQGLHPNTRRWPATRWHSTGTKNTTTTTTVSSYCLTTSCRGWHSSLTICQEAGRRTRGGSCRKPFLVYEMRFIV